MKKLNLEEIFISALGTKQRLKWYLVHRINVVSYMEANNPGIMSLIGLAVAFIPKKKRVEIIGGIDSKRLLETLKKERPELHGMIIDHPDGRIWLDQQVMMFRKRFL